MARARRIPVHHLGKKRFGIEARRFRPSALECLERRRLLSTVNWTGAGDGKNWSDINNWDSHALPTSSDDVVISASRPGPYVQSSGNVTVKSLNDYKPLHVSDGSFNTINLSKIYSSLTLSGGTFGGGGPIAVYGSGSYWVGGTLGGSVTNAGTLTVNPNSTVSITGSLTNSGTIVVVDGATVYQANANTGTTIVNQATGVFDLQGSASLSGNTSGGSYPGISTFINAGTLEKSTGTGTSNFGYALTSTSTSKIIVNSGTLLLQGGSGTMNVTANDSGIVVLGGNYSGTITGSGTGAVQLTAFGGIGSGVTLNFTGQTLQWTNGIIPTLSHNFVNALTGKITNVGTLTVVQPASNSTYFSTLAITAALTNSGTIVVPDGVTVYQASAYIGTTIVNQVGGVFDLQGSATLSGYTRNGNDHPGGTFTNAGTLEKSTGAGTTDLDYPVTSTGNIVVNSGMLMIHGGSGTTNTVVTANGTGVVVLEDSYSGVIKGSGTGVVQLNGFNGAGSGVTLNFTGQTLQWTNTTVTNLVNVNGLTGTITNLGTLTVVPSAVNSTLAITAVLTNSGTIVVLDGVTVYQANAYTGTTIVNKAGATLDLQGSANLSGYTSNGNYYPGGTFTNAGTLEKSTGAGTTDLGYPVTSTGNIVVNSGMLMIHGGSGTTNTVVTANGTGVVVLEDSYSGVIKGSGTGAVQLNGFNGAGSGVTLNFTGQTLQWTNTTVTNLVNINNLTGTITNLGTLTVVPSAVNSTLAITAAFTNSGTIVIPDGVTVYQASAYTGTTIVNQLGGVFDLQGSATLSGYTRNGNYYPGGIFTNAGTLEKSTGAGIAFLGYLLSNTGTINVNASTLYLSGGLTNFNAPTTTLTGGSYLVKGTLQFDGANIGTNNAAIVLNGTTSSIVDGSGNNALANFTTNAAGASFSLQGGQSFTAGSPFTNSGIVAIGGGSQFHAVQSYRQTAGTTSTLLAGGTASLVSDTNVIQIDGGTLDGSGTITGNVNNAGALRPGGVGAAGTITVTGNYTQTSTGSLVVEVGGTTAGTQFDILNVSGNATIQGSLVGGALGGYAPPAGSTFRVVTANSASITFASSSGLDFGSAVLFPSANATGLTLVTNVRPVTTAPKPVIGSNQTATVTLSATDAETSASSLVIKITSLPWGTLTKSDGTPVTVGMTFTGGSVTLNYAMPSLTGAFDNFLDSFGYSVTDTGVPLGAATTTAATVVLSYAQATTSGTEIVGGSSGNDTILATSASGNLQLTFNGNVTATLIPISAIKQLNVYGRDGNDTIRFTGLAVPATLDGGNGTNTLIEEGTAGSDNFTVNSTNVIFNNATITASGLLTLSGLGGDDRFTVNGTNANVILSGDDGNDTFTFANAASIIGNVFGGAGTNVIDESAYSTAVSANLGTAKLTGIGGTFANIASIMGGTAANTLTGPSAASIFAISGADTGTVGGVKFSHFGSLVGSAANDRFVLAAGATLSGSVDGLAGTDTIDESAYTTPIAANLITSKLTGFGGTFQNIEGLVGGSGSNTLNGPTAATAYNITGPNTGNLGGTFSFGGFGTLIGGAGSDTFVFSDQASLTGSIDGGAGANGLDYRQYTTGITVNLLTGKATGVGSTISNFINVRGGSGNDLITGNNAGNVLIGGPGDDTITAGNGRNILIGGTGSDTVNGGSADDIVIGGGTSYDGDSSTSVNFIALDTILAEWTSTTDNYASRITKIKAGLTGPDASTDKLVWGTTVTDDKNPDVLYGNSGTDWFFEGAGDNADNLPGEQLN